MKVRELVELLKQMDQDKEVLLWNCEWDSKDPIDEVEFDEDGNVLII